MGQESTGNTDRPKYLRWVPKAPERIYVRVSAVFDNSGFVMPHSIIWKDGRVFRIEDVKDFCPASFIRKGMEGKCYTVVIKGKNRYLFFEKTGDEFPASVGRWFVEKNEGT